MGSGCTKTEAGDVQQPPIETVDGEQANGTHSADSKKGVFFINISDTVIVGVLASTF